MALPNVLPFRRPRGVTESPAELRMEVEVRRQEAVSFLDRAEKHVTCMVRVAEAEGATKTVVLARVLGGFLTVYRRKWESTEPIPLCAECRANLEGSPA